MPPALPGFEKCADTIAGVLKELSGYLELSRQGMAGEALDQQLMGFQGQTESKQSTTASDKFEAAPDYETAANTSLENLLREHGVAPLGR